MPILNYSTAVPVNRTLAEIQNLLARIKCRQILTEMDEAGVVVGISFRVSIGGVVISYRMPANIDNVLIALHKSSKVPRRLKTSQHAARVAWRIVKDWLEAQVAFIEADQVELGQVFLAYAQGPDGRTLYESLKAGGFTGFALQ